MTPRVLVLLVGLCGCGGAVVPEEQREVNADGGVVVDGFNVDAYIPPPPDTGPAFDAAAGDAPATTSECIRCNLTHCDERACNADPMCNKQEFCRAACIDDDCHARCKSLYPSPLYDLWWGCMIEHCSKACGL